MLSLYLIALLVGGFLLALSMFGGGHDADVDASADADLDVDGDIDGDIDGGHDGFDAALAWLPVASLRFWTFFAAFFGLTGLVLDVGKLTGPWVGLGLAAAVGYVCGASMTAIVRRIRRERVDSSLSAEDCVGETARVVLPVTSGRAGKIRLQIKGRTIELVAETDEETELSVGQSCMVYEIKDGHAVVARAAELESPRNASGVE
jgi:membrane protein implicated in regulation of membrane protease activity